MYIHVHIHCSFTHSLRYPIRCTQLIHGRGRDDLYVVTEISSMTCTWASLLSVSSTHDHGGVVNDITGAI